MFYNKLILNTKFLERILCSEKCACVIVESEAGSKDTHTSLKKKYLLLCEYLLMLAYKLENRSPHVKGGALAQPHASRIIRFGCMRIWWVFGQERGSGTAAFHV